MSIKQSGVTTGYLNPALAALCAAEHIFPNDEIDRGSFEEVARVIGDSPESVTRNGFFVNDAASFEKLCQIGGFTVECAGGRVRCAA